MRYSFLATLLLVFTFGCAHGPNPAPTTHPDDAVNSLLDEDYEATMKKYPTWASMLGDRRYDTELTDNSPEGIAKRRAATKEMLARAKAISTEGLSDAAKTNLQLFIWEQEESIESAQYRSEWTPISQMGGPHTSFPQLANRITFTTEKHHEDYVIRIGKIAGSLENTLNHLKAGLAAGHTPPKIVMAGVMGQMASQTKASYSEDPSTHPLYKPFKKRDANDPLAVKARAIIKDQILPAMQKLSDYLEKTYIPGCRETTAAKDGPGGMEFYNFRLKHYTTLPLTAKEIHETGLSEVARIRAEMMETIARSDYPNPDKLEGDGLFAAFLQYLRTDKRFYYTDLEEMLRDYSHIAKTMDAELPKLFGKLPRLPYGIKPMPDHIAERAPTAYYYQGSVKNGVSGTFIVNTSRLDQRPRYEMRALTYHEAMPGHHLQIALSQELEEAGMHRWRELVGYTAFVEGWGLYSERLGLEVGGKDGDTRGFYEDPYDDFGRLTYEMWRALRLVVDTGLHAFGWEREKTIEYMLANSALTRANVENEVDRYISWPGQAVAYKTGELRIRALRAEAEKKLGEKFDIRGFHDVVLEQGAIPLEVLSARVNAWIEKLANTPES